MDNERDIHPSKRLGRLPAKVSRKALQFADFFQFVKLPKETHHWEGRPDLPLRSFGNTSVGDCTRAKQAMATVRMELLEQDRLVTITDEEVVRVYYDMTQRLYGGGDTGAYEEDALNDWRRPETTFKDVEGRAYTIDAFLLINPKNQQEVKAAISLAGAKGIAICFDLPQAWQNIEPPTPWTIPTDGTPIIGQWTPGSWGGHCLAGDTPIPLLKGETVPIQDLVGATDLWVYGVQSTSQPSPARAQSVVRTTRAETIRIVPDLGPAIRTTRDHRFMLRDGTYCRADQLTIGTRLMPLRKMTHHMGYELLRWYEKGQRQQIATHRLVATLVHGAKFYEVTHHRDSNKRNNDPSNIEVTTQSEHPRIHQPWKLSSMTGAPGWFGTNQGRQHARMAASTRQRDECGQFIPDSENHKVVAIERGGEEWVYDLINVSPTSNFAAGSVFVHNSMWCSDYDDFGIVVDDTWNHPRRHVSWEAVAAYMDEAHLVIDSIDAWSHLPPAPSGALDLDAVVEAVNTVSDYAVQEKRR